MQFYIHLKQCAVGFIKIPTVTFDNMNKGNKDICVIGVRAKIN